MRQVSISILVYGTTLPTFFERAQVEGLPDGEYGLDEDAHDALGRVDAADHAEGVQAIQLNLNRHLNRVLQFCDAPCKHQEVH